MAPSVHPARNLLIPVELTVKTRGKPQSSLASLSLHSQVPLNEQVDNSSEDSGPRVKTSSKDPSLHLQTPPNERVKNPSETSSPKSGGPMNNKEKRDDDGDTGFY